jgi:hypothetical protein
MLLTSVGSPDPPAHPSDSIGAEDDHAAARRVVEAALDTRSSARPCHVPTVNRDRIWQVRLQGGDELVREEIAAAVLPGLQRGLGRCSLDPGNAATAASDSLLDFFSHPDRYNADLLPLDAFLRLIAKRKLAKIERSERRRRRHEVPVASLPERVEPCDPQVSQFRRVRLLFRVCQTEAERVFFRSRLRGESRPCELAEIMGLAGLDEEQQRRERRRMLERIRMRVRRFRSVVP